MDPGPVFLDTTKYRCEIKFTNFLIMAFQFFLEVEAISLWQSDLDLLTMNDFILMWKTQTVMCLVIYDFR